MQVPSKIEIIENFVDENFIQQVLPLIPDKEKKKEKRNQILRWGSKIPYSDNIKSEIIPDVFLGFKNKFEFDSVTINEYYPGQYIDWHIDKPYDNTPVIIISLLSDAVLKFRKEKDILSFAVPKNSLTIFQDELKTDWQHSLLAEEKRYSIVFRNSKS
jgi:alkylated DNA repair dioxygenase AlkB